MLSVRSAHPELILRDQRPFAASIKQNRGPNRRARMGPIGKEACPLTRGASAPVFSSPRPPAQLQPSHVTTRVPAFSNPWGEPTVVGRCEVVQASTAGGREAAAAGRGASVVGPARRALNSCGQQRAWLRCGSLHPVARCALGGRGVWVRPCSCRHASAALTPLAIELAVSENRPAAGVRLLRYLHRFLVD